MYKTVGYSITFPGTLNKDRYVTLIVSCTKINCSLVPLTQYKSITSKTQSFNLFMMTSFFLLRNVIGTNSRSEQNRLVSDVCKSFIYCKIYSSMDTELVFQYLLKVHCFSCTFRLYLVRYLLYNFIYRYRILTNIIISWRQTYPF